MTSPATIGEVTSTHAGTHKNFFGGLACIGVIALALAALSAQRPLEPTKALVAVVFFGLLVLATVIVFRLWRRDRRSLLELGTEGFRMRRPEQVIEASWHDVRGVNACLVNGSVAHYCVTLASGRAVLFSSTFARFREIEATLHQHVSGFEPPRRGWF
jgi:hypothetical protein